MPAAEGLYRFSTDCIIKLIIVIVGSLMAAVAVGVYLWISIKNNTLDIKDVVIIAGIGYTAASKAYFGVKGGRG